MSGMSSRWSIWSAMASASSRENAGTAQARNFSRSVEGIVGMAAGAAERGCQRAAVPKRHGHACPRLLLEAVGHRGVGDHGHALHQPLHVVADGAVAEVEEADAAVREGHGRAVRHRELPLQPVGRPFVAQHVGYHAVDADLDACDLSGDDRVGRS